MRGEWFWAMFEPNLTCRNYTFGQRFSWIGTHNYQIRLPRGYTSDFDQCLNRLQLKLITRLVYFACELGQIINIHCIWVPWGYARPNWFWAIFERTSLFVQCYSKLFGQTMTRYFLLARWCGGGGGLRWEKGVSFQTCWRQI